MGVHRIAVTSGFAQQTKDIGGITWGRKIVVFLVLCMLAATFVGCGTKSTTGVGTSDMAADQTVRYNLASEPASLDPALAPSNPEIETVLQLFDG